MASPAPASVLYPETVARRWQLPASNGHLLQVYEWGAPEGIPALLLHGGPGSGMSPVHARFFDPARYRVIGFDQRGTGLSQPAGRVIHNTTADLLADARLVRETLGIDRWLVVGGSWGATLALLHAIDDPQAAAGVLLRGTFLARAEDLAAFFDPLAWRDWQSGDAPLLESLDEIMQTGSRDEQERLMQHWWNWELSMDGANSASSGASNNAGPPFDKLLPRYRVQAHYLRHQCWLASPPLLDRLQALPPVPVRLLHGTSDHTCPIESAQALKRRYPAAELILIEGAGHAPTHPVMAAAMVASLNGWAETGNFGKMPTA